MNEITAKAFFNNIKEKLPVNTDNEKDYLGDEEISLCWYFLKRLVKEWTITKEEQITPTKKRVLEKYAIIVIDENLTLKLVRKYLYIKGLNDDEVDRNQAVEYEYYELSKLN